MHYLNNWTDMVVVHNIFIYLIFLRATDSILFSICLREDSFKVYLLLYMVSFMIR